MVSLDNLKTTINAIKCLLTDYPKKKDIPTKLPNPNPLTFTGTVTGSYDGSAAVNIEIPESVEIDNETIVKTEDGKLKANVPTKTSELENDSGFVAASELAGKQDIISDLATIRSGAAKGATALQSVPSSYRTAAAQDVIDNGKQDKLIAGANITIAADGKTISATGGGGSVQSDWNQNDSTAADYVKNRPFYAGDPVETVFVEERTELFYDVGDGIYDSDSVFESTFVPTGGEIYTVSWDGTVYECICVEDVIEGEVEDEPVYYIGNRSISSDPGSDTGEPFIFTSYANGSIYVSTKDTSASHTFSISRIDIEIVKIPTKYLPVASEIEPGIMSVNDMLQQVEDKYFLGTTTRISGHYYDRKIIEECANYNNSRSIYSLNKINGAVLSFYDDAVNKNITFVLSDSESIECWKLSESNPFREKLWGIYKDGVVISSSTTDSTKTFKITVDDSGTISATEVT